MEQTVSCSKEARSLDLVREHSEHPMALTISKVFQNSTQYVQGPEVPQPLLLDHLFSDHTLHMEQSWAPIFHCQRRPPDTTQPCQAPVSSILSTPPPSPPTSPSSDAKSPEAMGQDRSPLSPW